MKHKWYRPVLYSITIFLHQVLLCVPRSVALTLAAMLSRAAYCVVRRERKKAESHLAAAFGDAKSPAEIRGITKKVFRNLAFTACDFALFPKLRPEHISRIVTIENPALLEKYNREEGRGVILLTGHLGNWEMLAAALIAQGYSGMVLGKRLRYEKYNELVVAVRRSQGVETYYRDQSPRALIRLLKQGKVVGILPDQDIADVEGVYVDFFNRPAYTPTGPAKLALAAGVPILTAFLLREGRRYRLVFDAEVDTRRREGESKEDAIRRITVDWNAIIEKYITMYPDQWAWVHNRWKTQK